MRVRAQILLVNSFIWVVYRDRSLADPRTMTLFLLPLLHTFQTLFSALISNQPPLSHGEKPRSLICDPQPKSVRTRKKI